MQTRSYRPLNSSYGNPVSTAAASVAAMREVAKNSATASRRKESGRSIESLFERTHETYRMRGDAVIVHLHPPTVGPPTALRFSGDGHIDYMGALRGGRAITFDAKGVTGSASLTMPPVPPLGHKRFKQMAKDRQRFIAQASLLLSLQRAGALAAFVCVDTKRERAWIMSDLDRILRDETVPLRHRDADLWPAVALSTLEEIARGAPSIDYLSVWPR